MSAADTLARGLTPRSRPTGARDRAPGLPALFGETSPATHAPAVGDDRRLRTLQAQLIAHRNPLISASAPLLDLIVVIIEGARHETPHELRMQVASEIREFHHRLELRSVSLHSMRVSSYALCGAIDEAVLTTDWGAESDWSADTLLWAFHQDSSGGENFFRYLSDLASSPDMQAELVELLVLLLDLGFQGPHRISHDGAHALETIRLRLHAAARAHRPEAESPVGAPGPAADTGPSPWRTALKAFAVCVALALLAGYSTLYVRTQSLAEPLAARLASLVDEYTVPAGPRAAPPD